MDDLLDIKEWLRFANMDLDSAKYLMDNMWPRPLEIVCYHCQQSAEKFLKTIAIELGMPLRKTHDLQILTSMIKDCADIPDNILECTENLTRYGVKMRYPNEMCTDEVEARLAIAHAERVKSWAESMVQLGEDSSHDNGAKDKEAKSMEAIYDKR